ncbi:MAG TPA: hypothetical protein VII99_17595 [Bacteroidia bacterium]
MKNRKYISYLLVLAYCLLALSCHKSGPGGEMMLMITPQHHGNNIINHIGWPDTVFLKYNTDELPGTKPSDYDTYFVGTPRQSDIECDNLKWGKYYVYVVGVDSSGPYRVTGGLPVNVKRSQRKSMVMITVPVTE